MKFATPVFTIAAGLMVAGICAPAQAQKAEDTRTQITDIEVGMMRKDLRDQKKQIVAVNLPLPGDEATRFWPLYDTYTSEHTKVYDRRYALVKEYAANYTSLTDEKAAAYIRSSISIDEAASELRLAWIPKFEALLGKKKAAMFFQIDRRLGLMVELQLASQIPLIQPLWISLSFRAIGRWRSPTGFQLLAG